MSTQPTEPKQAAEPAKLTEDAMTVGCLLDELDDSLVAREEATPDGSEELRAILRKYDDLSRLRPLIVQAVNDREALLQTCRDLHDSLSSHLEDPTARDGHDFDRTKARAACDASNRYLESPEN